MPDAKNSACQCGGGPRTGCDREIWFRRRTRFRANAIATAAQIPFLAMESSNQLPLSHQIGDRSDPARASKTTTLAVYRRAQQWDPAGQRARVRLLSSPRPPNAEWACLSFRDRQRHFDWEWPDRSGRPLAPADQRRPCAQRLFEQHFARHLSRGRFQSRPANACTTRIMRRTHSLPARTLR